MLKTKIDFKYLYVILKFRKLIELHLHLHMVNVKGVCVCIYAYPKLSDNIL